MGQRIAFFHPDHGIGLTVAAGSGRSWIDLPDGDPVHAHCRLDVPCDALLAGVEAAPRPSSWTLFVRWPDLLRFAADLDALDAAGRGVVSLGDRVTMLRVRLRRDGRVRASARFTVGHHVTFVVRCDTRWEHADLAGVSARVRAAVLSRAPRPGGDASPS